jgi:prepilin-type processing-associated H-X9-DG protein
MKQKITPFVEGILCLTTLILLVAVTIPVFSTTKAQAQTSGVDRVTLAGQYASQLRNAMYSYASDYDQVLPVFTPLSAFETIVSPYATNLTNLRKIMRDPAARNAPFTLNAALSGQSFSTLGNDFSTVELFRDSVTPPDGKILIAYLDGYTTRGGQSIVNPIDESLQFGQRLGAICMFYAQDNDETLPDFSDYTVFKNATMPYTRTSRPYTLAPSNTQWVLNTSLSNVALATLENPAITEMLRDPIVRADGKITIVYADGHAERVTP